MESEILLVQLPLGVLVPHRLTANLPMAAASLILHTRHDPDLPPHLRPALLPTTVANRAGDSALIREIADRQPRIVGFTCTVWNIERVLYVARRLKEIDPSIAVWLGGPEIAADSWAMVDPHAPFDLAVEGEGEQVFVSLLKHGGDAPEHPLLLPGGKRVGRGKPIPTLTDLSTIHDPFLAGLVEPEGDRSMLIELWRGCKNRCAFCRYHQSRPKSPAMRSYAQIEEVFAWAREHDIGDIYILDPSPDQRPDLPELLDLLSRCNRSPQIPIFAELRVDRLDQALASRLRKAGITRVETGLQTVNQATLAKVARKMDLQRFQNGLNALANAEIQVKVDLMTGLPEDSEDGLLDSCAFLKDIGFARHVQIFRTQALPGTRLRQMASSWGLTCEQRPPYFVTSTRLWPQESLDQAIWLAEEALEISQAPEDRPVLQAPRWLDNAIIRHRYPNSDAVLQLAVDLDRQDGMESWNRERFVDIGTALTLWIKARDPTGHISAICRGVERMLQDNPFTSLCLAIESEPEIPRDLFDALGELLDRHRLGHYLPRFHAGTTSTVRPERRLLSLMEQRQRQAVDPDWLEALRPVAEVVWFCRCRDWEEALEQIKAQPGGEEDYLLIDLEHPVETGLPPHFQRLFDATAAPDLLLLSPVHLHWAWTQYQAQTE
ncbi:MAG: radical SAM protein [Bradymonadales bacterium]|nr:radical SAM protein [Bradymonadales bacterium]